MFNDTKGFTVRETSLLALLAAVWLHAALFRFFPDVHAFTIETSDRELEEYKITLILEKKPKELSMKKRTGVRINVPKQIPDQIDTLPDTNIVADKKTHAADWSDKTTIPDNIPFAETGLPFPEIPESGNSFIDFDASRQDAISFLPMVQGQDFGLDAIEAPALSKFVTTEKSERGHKQSEKNQAAMTSQRPVVPVALGSTTRSRPPEKNDESHAMAEARQSYFVTKHRYAKYYKKLDECLLFPMAHWKMTNTEANVGNIGEHIVYVSCWVSRDGSIKSMTIEAPIDSQAAANIVEGIMRMAARAFPPFPDYVKEETLPLLHRFHF